MNPKALPVPLELLTIAQLKDLAGHIPRGTRIDEKLKSQWSRRDWLTYVKLARPSLATLDRKEPNAGSTPSRPIPIPIPIPIPRPNSDIKVYEDTPQFLKDFIAGMPGIRRIDRFT